MSLRFAVVYEALADFRTASELADRLLVESIDWLAEADIEHQRSWVHETDDGPLTWGRIGALASAANIRAMGHFDGRPGAPDAAVARRAILYLRRTFLDLAGILLIRHRDHQPERRTGLEQAR
ncbi:hypothetical protein [Aquisphaera giovannonii]|uniref:hypothetical protein n=1 Tax=Aquisphaera giovannonii TaxID=406548 RepID=UPI0011E0447C|nr:hypothetical protein [Aquisphaera giovannonii]